MIHVSAFVRLLTTDERSDRDLIAAYLRHRDEQAFAELIRRYGPMVWGICRRMLPDRADAEDTFQAVFLVLLRKSVRLGSMETLGPWLYRVAVWTARNLKRKNAIRLSRTVPLIVDIGEADQEPNVDLDSLLMSLSERDREPLVLCHLLGLSRREAAKRLGYPEGTLSARLSRALAKLRDQFQGRNDLTRLIATGAVIVPGTLATASERSVWAGLHAAGMFETATSLADGVLHMIGFKKAAVTALVAVIMIASGGMVLRFGMQSPASAMTEGQESNESGPSFETIENQQARAEIKQADRKAKLKRLNEVRKSLDEKTEELRDLQKKLNQGTDEERQILVKQFRSLSYDMGSDQNEEIKLTTELFYLIRVTRTKPDREYRHLYQREKQLAEVEKTRPHDDRILADIRNVINALQISLVSGKNGCIPCEVIESTQIGNEEITSVAWTKEGLKRVLLRLNSESQDKGPLIAFEEDSDLSMADSIIRIVKECGLKTGQIRQSNKTDFAFRNIKLLHQNSRNLYYEVTDFSTIELNFK